MNVEDLLEIKGVRFKPAGKDVQILCLSPEHDDSNPSTRVDRVTGIFHCLSCGHKGNIFDFFNELRDFKSEKILSIRKKIQEILTSMKGILIPEGAVPFTRDFRDIKGSTYKELGAFTSSDFEDRIVFPITDISGKIVAFSARHMLSDASPKYIISPVEAKLPIYPAIIKPYLGSVILVEGIFDFINLKDKGITNVGCLFGTRTLSLNNVEEKLMPILLAGTKLVYLMLDGDVAGRKAAEDIKKIITTKTRLVVEIIELADDSDPGDFDQGTVNVIMSTIYKKDT